jgi:hypothetical protein
MQANAGAVLPSSSLARLPSLDTIKRGTDCTLGGLQFTVEKETAQAVALQDAYYGNPGDSGLKRTRAEGAILDRLEDTDQVNTDAAHKMDAAQRQFLAKIAQPFAARVATLRTCTVKREAIIADAKAADVRGANVKLVLRPLVAWEKVMFLPAEWTGICESSQRRLLE